MNNLLNAYNNILSYTLTAILLLFVFYNIDSLSSNDVDIAHHYALIRRIYDEYTLGSIVDSSLGEMAGYPRGSHYLAVIVGTLVNSCFLGMQIISIFFIATIWLSIVLILSMTAEGKSKIILSIFSIIIVLNALTLRMQIHGNEIINTFLYSQLSGQAILFLSILLGIIIEKYCGLIQSSVALAILMLIIESMHLLPAILIAGIVGGKFIFYLVTKLETSKQFFKTAICLFVVNILSLIGLIIHPSFSAMTNIAKYNSASRPDNISYPVGFICLSLAIILTSSIILYQNSKKTNYDQLLVEKNLVLYGYSTAFLCITQYALTYFTDYSDYAVVKYAYSLITLLFLHLSIIIAEYLLSSQSIYFRILKITYIPKSIFTAVTLCIVLFIGLPIRKLIDVSNVVSVEKKLTEISDVALPMAIDRPNVVIGLNDFYPIINYMFSLTITKTPREMLVDVLKGGDLFNISDYSYIISSSSNYKYGSAGCESTSKSSISVVSSKCIEQRWKENDFCKNTFDFTIDGYFSEKLLKGFSGREPHGRWSEYDSAQFQCEMPENYQNKPKLVKILASPYLHNFLTSQRIEILINGRSAYQDRISLPRGFKNPIVIHLPYEVMENKYVFDFNFPDSQRPSDLGIGSLDSRKLGFTIKKIIFE